jgi:hypothetical protein
MTQRFSFVLTAMLGAAWLVPAYADAPGVNKDTAANAALYYWQAFQAMPTFDAEKEKRVEDWKEGPPPAELQKFLAGDAGFLRLLHRGARQPRCEWGLVYEDGEHMFFVHVQPARQLAKWACRRARARFEAGQHRGGVDDVIAALTLARHVGSDPAFISILVQYSMENYILQEVAPYLPRMDAAALSDLAARLESLPPRSSLKTAVLLDREYHLRWWMKRLQAVDKDRPEEFLKLLLSAVGSADEETLKRDVVEFAGKPPSREKVLKHLKALEPYYDEAANLMETPWKEWHAMIAASEEEIQGGSPANPLLRTDARFAGVRLTNPLMRVTPALGKLRLDEARTKARWAMFQAAIAVVQGGPEKLKDHPDPYGDGAFEYRRLENGFELESKIKGYKVEPWGAKIVPTLTVGQRKRG